MFRIVYIRNNNNVQMVSFKERKVDSNIGNFVFEQFVFVSEFWFRVCIGVIHEINLSPNVSTGNDLLNFPEIMYVAYQKYSRFRFAFTKGLQTFTSRLRQRLLF